MDTNGEIKVDVAGLAISNDTPKSEQSTIAGSRKMQNEVPPPIAIVGMAARLPGGVNSIPAMYEFLRDRKDGLCDIPLSRFNINGFHNDGDIPYSMKSQKAYFIDDDVAMMDASFFGLSEVEAAGSDPRARLLLEVVYECLENAGQTAYRGDRIGCYIGAWGADWAELTLKDGQHRNPMIGAAAGSFFLSSYIAWNLDLHGPTMTIETACSSSMVALHEACQALYSGECSSALVGGANLILTPTLHMNLASSGVLSPSGQCKTFDASADGFGRAEAVNAVLIKPLEDAVRDGDRVRAVIRATAVNNDGRTVVLSTPSADAQEPLIRSAYRKAGIDAIDGTAYFECHGTGTMVGDVTEMSAVAKVFPSGIHVGSVKPNFGHSEGTSGITSLIKAVLSLERKSILPHIHMVEPNPKIPFESAGLIVPKHEMAWPQGRKERISVNNFGVGGTNVHLILDSASSFGLDSTVSPALNSTNTRLLVLSANSEKSLRKRIEEIEAYIEGNPKHVADLAFTLGERREHLTQRAFMLATEDSATGSFNVGAVDTASTPETTFVFTGQGAQWPGMGRSLIQSFDRFRSSIKLLDFALQTLQHPPAWTLQDLLCNDNSSHPWNSAEFAQPLCCAIQIGLVDLLVHWGITPASVIGHSSGEIAAAYAAGALTAEEAIRVAYQRGEILQKVQRRGGMAAISMGREEVTPYLTEGVVIACENSQQSVTLSGDRHVLERIMERIQSDDPDALCRLLRVDKAYHSSHMQDAANEYEASLQELQSRGSSSMVPFFSSVTGARITDPSELDGKYWRRNLESPVLFLAATNAILDSKEDTSNSVFVEIGPHSALSGPLRQILSEHPHGESCSYIPSLVRGEDPKTSVLYAAGNLYNAGVSVSFRAINGEGNLLVDLPPYPWQHDTRYWSQTPAVEAWRHRKYPHHELLGSRVLGSTDLEPSWRNTLSLDDAPWLYGHRVLGKTLFPGAGYIAMTGEAFQQITNSSTLKYQINHLVLKSALFIDSNESVELITNMRPARISDIQDSDWYEFSITSVQAGEATRLCVGQVRAAPSLVPSNMPLVDGTQLKRHVTSATWYKGLREIGMDYNREFRGLDDISADPIRHVATGTVKTAKVSPSRYVMHPTTIDRCLQLLSVAMFRGLTRNINIRSLPVLFEDIFVSPETEELYVQAQTDAGKGNFILGDVGAMSKDQKEILLSITGARLHILGDDTTAVKEGDLASRPVWKPHIDFIPAASMAKPPPALTLDTEVRDRLVGLFIAETAARVQDIEPSEDHLLKYKRWLRIGQSRIQKQGTWSLSDFGYAPDCPFDSSAPLQMMEWLTEKAEEYAQLIPLVACMHRVLDNIVGVFEGTVNALHLLMENDGLKDVYDVLLSFDSCNEFFTTLGHSNPELKLLEVGAGTGSATARFLEYLHAPDGSRLYSKYTFSDVSAGFLAAARERFSRYDGMEYAVLNISEDPAAQGIELGKYDLVIASNVIHATPSLNRSLSNIKKLLAPGGRLFLQELAEECRGAEYIFGLLPGWWVGESDQRVDKPYVSVDRWRQEMKAAGFNGIDFAIHEQTSLLVNLVSSFPVSPVDPQIVNLLVPGQHSQWILDVAKRFTTKGHQVNICTLDQPPPSEGDTISLLDATGPFLFDISTESFQQLKTFLLSPLVKRVLWVTRISQIGCADPRYGLIHGFLRALHGEAHTDGTSLSILDVEEFDQNTISHLLRVYEIQFSDESRREEYVLRNGVVHVGRFEVADMGKELESSVQGSTPRRLGIESTGLLDSMYWREDALPNPKVGEVLIRVAYIGLNFKDIITALGLIATPDQLGLEGSGVVQSVGPGVSTVKPGDRAIFLGPGCFATHIIVPCIKVISLPREWSLEEGATSPIVSLTAAQCLLRMGKLQPGQSVLIHAAAGGVGIAAIRICKGIGAKIYATVGNDAKAQYLMDTFGIPRSDIFHSRDSSFYTDLMRETGGRGVDIVLSSLSGELLQTSWKCVAPGGTMFDISRRDVLADAMLHMKHFVGRRSFVTVDLGEYMEEATDQSANFSIPVNQGLVGPISPVTCFDAADVPAAFRHMQTGQHIGKILVRIPEDLNTLPTRDTRAEIAFSPDYAYLLSGGLGGLGRALSNWMVEKGARCLVYLSPSAGTTEEHRIFAEELKCQGCEVIFIQGTAADKSDVQKAISYSPKPVKGVFQLALALKDITFERMTFEDWTIPLTAKVSGTWNLHQAFQNTALDFFVMLGSIAGIAGMTGQCNYSAANTFIHALERHRLALGQPASVLDLGPVADIGYVSRSPELTKMFSGRFEFQFIKEMELLDAVEALIYHSTSSRSSLASRYDLNHIILGLTPTAPWIRHRGDTRLAILNNRAQRRQQDPDTVDDIVDFVAQVESEPEVLNRPSTEEFLIVKVGHMIKTPNSKCPAKPDLKALAGIPIDSLIAIEARAWARKRLGIQINLSDITAAGNVQGLVHLAIDGMKKRYSIS